MQGSCQGTLHGKYVNVLAVLHVMNMLFSTQQTSELELDGNRFAAGASIDRLIYTRDGDVKEWNTPLGGSSSSSRRRSSRDSHAHRAEH